MELIDFAPLLGIPAIVKVIDAYRLLVTDRDFTKAAYTVGAWLLGVGLVALVVQSSANPFGEVNWADMVLLGIGLGATASVVHDVATRGGIEYVTLNADVELLDEPADGTPPGIE